MKKILKNKSGMTLIELVVAMLIFAVFTTMVTTALSPMLRQFMHTNELAELNTLMGNIADDITNDITKSSELTITSDGKTLICGNIKGIVAYRTNDKGAESEKIKSALECSYDGVEYFLPYDRAYYKGKDLEMKVEKVTSPEAVKVTLTLKDNNGLKMLEREVKARPLDSKALITVETTP